MLDTNSFTFFMFIWIGTFLFCCFVSTFIFWIFKIKNLGFSLAMSYSSTVILATITVYNIHVDESGWYFMGVFILGFPLGWMSSMLSSFVDFVIEGVGFHNGGPASNGICLILGGGFQYYLIGTLLQKTIEWKWLKK